MGNKNVSPQVARFNHPEVLVVGAFIVAAVAVHVINRQRQEEILHQTKIVEPKTEYEALEERVHSLENMMKTEEKKKEPVVKKIEGINLVERLLTTEDSTARVRVGVAPE